MFAGSTSDLDRVEGAVLSYLKSATDPAPMSKVVDGLELSFDAAQVKLAALNLVSSGKVKLSKDWRFVAG